jgi:D-alanyl-lipoteichoic acid acyltransferase DltB (MBOAT superfamily)
LRLSAWGWVDALLFNSHIFIFVFMPAALLAYYLLGRINDRAAELSLVVSSLIFYAWWNPPFVLILMSSIAFNYSISHWITRNEGFDRRQSAILALGITANLAVLVYYKYLFALAGFLDSIGMASLKLNPVILPLGISFYTFTQIGYLVDCRQGMAKERGLLDYCLFVTFFPHLIAGPILHHREIMPQFAKNETYQFSRRNMAIGLTIFTIGLAKKVLIADSLSQVSNAGFDAPGTLGLIPSWMTALSFSLQIYFDFSGYSDMAIGLAYMFNVRFPLNFNSPYKARSIIDFWQRWHMTLTRYLTLYLYNPMALWITRRRVARGAPILTRDNKTIGGFLTMIAIPTFITMVLAGVWHGAGLTFLIFGLLHGFYLIVNHAWRIFMPAQARQDPKNPAALAAIVIAQVLLTYSAALVAQIFFRAGSANDATQLLAGMIGLHGGGAFAGWAYNFGSLAQSALRIAAFFGMVWLLPNTQQIMAKFPAALGQIAASRYRLLEWVPDLKWAVSMGLAAGLAIASLSQHSEFLYFQF